MTDEKPEKKVLSRMSKMITNQDVKMMEKFKWALESPALVLDLFRNSAEPHTHLDYAELSPAGDITTTTLTIVDMGAKESDVLDSTISQIDR